MTIEHVTLILLLALFIAAEVYRYTRGVRGVIVAEKDFGVPLPVSSVDVRLQHGEVVTASLNCCTACLGRLKIGDEVRVTQSRDGYVVDLPWSRPSRCQSGPNGC